MLFLGVVACGAMAGVFLARPLWRADEILPAEGNGGVRQEPLAASQPAGPEAATGPVAPVPVPAEPEALPPAPAASPAEPNRPPQVTKEALKQEAMEAVSRLVEDFPNSPDPLGLMGQLYVALGKTSEAVGCWEKSLKLDPNCTEAYRCMAELALKKGESEKAALLSRRALQIDPKCRGVHGQLAQALIRLGKLEEAVAELEEDVKISPRASLSYYLLGHTHHQLKDYQKAKESYQKALQLDPNYTEASYGLAVVCARLGQEQEAEEYRQTFKRLKAHDWKNLSDPRDALDEGKFLASLSRGVAETLTNVGLVYQQHEFASKAESAWRRAAVLDPRNVVCREELAALCVKKGKNEEALRLYQQLHEIVPRNPQYCLNAGVLYAGMGQMDAALAAVEQAIQIDPRNPDYRRVYERMKERK